MINYEGLFYDVALVLIGVIIGWYWAMYLTDRKTTQDRAREGRV